MILHSAVDRWIYWTFGFVFVPARNVARSLRCSLGDVGLGEDEISFSMEEGRWQVMAAYRSVAVVSISDCHSQTAIDLEVLPVPSFSD